MSYFKHGASHAFLFIRMKRIRGGSNILSISILFSLKFSYNILKFKTKATKKKKEQGFFIYLTVYLHRHCVLLLLLFVYHSDQPGQYS